MARPSVMPARAESAERPFEGDAQLAAALASFDARAWRQLFEEQYDRVYRYAYLRTGNAADADDVAATVFGEAVLGIRKFRYQGVPLAAWLFRIAHNETVDLLKRRTRTAASSLGDMDGGPDFPAVDGTATIDARQDVSEALGALSQQQRDVLVLRMFQDRSVADVAAIMGKTEGAVKVTQMRALRALRRKLGR